MRHLARTLLLLLCLTSCTTNSDRGPEETLRLYIESLRQGDLDGVRRAYFDAENFSLPGPLPIDSFHVTREQVLDERAASERPFTPSPQAGDVELDVRQYEQGREQMYTYNLRRIEGRWWIYSHSAWGVDAADYDEEM